MTEKIIMDRQLFKKPFKQTDNVILPCPTCKGLSLKLDNRKFYAFDTALSRKIQESEEEITHIVQMLYQALLER